MEDPRARQRREYRVEMQQRVLQCTRPIAGAGVHHQAGRLVDDEELRIGVDEVEIHRLRLDCGNDCDLDLHRHALSTAHDVARSQLAPVDADAPGFDPVLEA